MNVKKFFASLLISILVLSTVVCGVFSARVFFGSNISKELAGLLDRPKDKLNFLLVGTDKGGLRADVIMLVSFDTKAHTVKIISIPRDTRVNVSSSRYDKINHVLGYNDGQSRLVTCVKSVTNMPIHYYAQLDFEGFRNIIDIVGGVDFDLPINMNYDDPYQDLHIHLNKGFQHFDGKMAEGLVRYRATYANGDEGRISMQQDFLKAIFEQKLSPQYLVKAPKIIKEVYEHIETNFELSDALKYVSALRKLDSDSLSTFKLPGAPQTISGISYYVYSRTETANLILKEFGYPEDKAKAVSSSQNQN